MAIIQLQLRQGPEAQRAQLTPLEGEMIYTTDTKMLFVGDGVTAGGNALRAPMPAQGTADSSDLVASTRFVQQVLANVTGTNLSDYARKALDNNFTANNNFVIPPTISGVIPLTDNSTKVPTTAWVRSQLASVGSTANAAIKDQANTFTSINDFTVSPTAPTPAVNDASSKIATTQFVKNVLNSNGLGLSTITITAGTGTSINYSAGTVTLPNGQVVNVTLGSVSLPANGTYYITVDSTGTVGYTNQYPSGNGIRVIGTVTVLGGAITGLDLSGTDLSSYAKLSGATFSGPIKAPTPLQTVSDTTVATTEWVNSRLGGGGATNDVVLESTSNTYASSTTQDFTLATTLVSPLSPTDDSNKAASTSFVHDAIDTALSGNADLTQYARKDGATFSGIARGPVPSLTSNDDQLATTSWVRNIVDDMIEGGDIFPILTARVGSRIIDHGTGSIRISPTSICSIGTGDIEVPANQTVWIYVDPTCGINHYPFTSVAIKPPTGKAFAYAVAGPSNIISITMLKPDTVLKGNVIVDNDLLVEGSTSLLGGLNVVGPVSFTPPLSLTSASAPTPANAVGNEIATAAWVRNLLDTLMPVGSIKLYWWPTPVITDAYGMVWALCNGQAPQSGWWWNANVPDFRDRVLMQEGAAGYQVGGANSITLSTDNIPGHSHNVNITHNHQVPYSKADGGPTDPGSKFIYDIGTTPGINVPGYQGVFYSDVTATTPASKTTDNGNYLYTVPYPFDNRPLYHTINYFIRVK